MGHQLCDALGSKINSVLLSYVIFSASITSSEIT